MCHVRISLSRHPGIADTFQSAQETITRRARRKIMLRDDVTILYPAFGRSCSFSDIGFAVLLFQFAFSL